MPKPRIALVHDWLTGMRGGEKVLEVLCEIFPDADIFTLVHLRGRVSKTIERHRIRTSWLQKVPKIDRFYRHFLPLMPAAIEAMDFSDYDLLISSSHCVAKGARKAPGARHVCYCHTPMRYIWDLYDDYFGQGRASFFVRFIMRVLRPVLRRWDRRTAAGVDQFIANSENVRERIQRLYSRDASVIYPPVDYSFYSAFSGDSPWPEDYYLIVSALAPYKRLDLAIEAFNRTGQTLLVIGDGQDNLRLRSLAGQTVKFLGWLSAEELRRHYAHCRALIFPGEEDFGIVPLEAMSAGRPVIAYGKGGALETVIDGVTGVLFKDKTAQALINAIERSAALPFDSTRIKQHAAAFDREKCKENLRQVFTESLK